MENNVPAIVIGGHFQGLGVIRALACRGIPVCLVDHEPSLSRFSRHIVRYYKSPDIRDQAESLAFFTRLAVKYQMNGAVLFPTDDETVFFLFSGRKVKKDHFDKVRGGLTLNKEGKVVLLQALNETFDKSIRYRGRNIKNRNIIQFECHRIANQLIKDEA